MEVMEDVDRWAHVRNVALKFVVDQQVEDIEMPENLKLNTFLQEFHSDCPHPECSFGFYGFAFGQSPFPVPKLIQEALIQNADKGAYAVESADTSITI